MANKARNYSAVFPIITKSDGDVTYVLLHRRKNTGYMDGRWDITASGHVDEGEAATEATVRECREELGIVVKPDDVHFAHLSHHFTGDDAHRRVYYDIYFSVSSFDGEPCIAEPDKCDALQWFDMCNLPNSMIDCRAAVLGMIERGIRYSEIAE